MFFLQKNALSPFFYKNKSSIFAVLFEFVKNNQRNN